MRKGLFLILCIALSFIFTGCGLNLQSADNSSSLEEVDYAVPSGWVQAEEYSSNEKIFYVQEGHESDNLPDNISVNVGSDKYGAQEHEDFRETIVSQLLAQIGDSNAEFYGDGTFTDNGDVLYIFTIVEEDCTTIQYYIVGENKFCLVHLTNFSGSENANKAALKLAKSVVWE